LAGSTQATRFAAARQIGDIAKSHPQDLNSLLKKMASIALIIIMSICNILMSFQVSQYLRSRNWDTRVAAAHAIGSIAENVRHTSLKELLKSLEGELMEAGYSDVCKDVGASVSDMCPNPTAGLSFKRCWNLVLHYWPQVDR
ncbi:unnamed protein product, partial [Musa textilis]